VNDVANPPAQFVAAVSIYFAQLQVVLNLKKSRIRKNLELDC
jgi:hypothetical protein